MPVDELGFLSRRLSLAEYREIKCLTQSNTSRFVLLVNTMSGRDRAFEKSDRLTLIRDQTPVGRARSRLCLKPEDAYERHCWRTQTGRDSYPQSGR